MFKGLTLVQTWCRIRRMILYIIGCVIIGVKFGAAAGWGLLLICVGLDIASNSKN